MAEKHRSWLQHIFGDEIGEMLQVMAFMPIFLLIFAGAPLLISRISKHPDHDTQLLAQLPKDSRELIEELASVQLKTQKLIMKLEGDTSSAETLLQEKQKSLDDLQRKIALLQLTPEQRAIVEQYNKTVSPDPNLWEWLTKRTTWYEAGVATLISWFFYFLGVRSGKKRNAQGK